MSDYQILLINNGLLFSPHMTQAEAHAYIKAHPDFEYRQAAM